MHFFVGITKPSPVRNQSYLSHVRFSKALSFILFNHTSTLLTQPLYSLGLFRLLVYTFSHGFFGTIIYWFFDQSNILLHKEVGNPLQIFKHVKTSSFQPILKLLVTFVGSLFTLKPFIGEFYIFSFWQNEGAILISNNWLCLNLCCCAWTCAVDGRCFICIILFSVVDYDISILNHKIILDQ